MAIKAFFFSCLVAATWGAAALANGVASLALTIADFERLGVEFEAAEPAQEVTIAAAPAEVVIPTARQAIVSTTVSGVLARLLVAEGDSVEAGQPLAEIQSAELLGLQKAFIDAAAAAELAQAQLQRDRGLHADGIVAERRLQESAVAARAVETGLDQARQQLLIAGMDAADIARLANSRELSPTLSLRAPFDSVVVGQLRSVGAHIDSLEPLFSVADLDTLWLEAHVPQERAERIEPGMQIAVTAGGRTLHAAITHIGRVVDSTSQTVLVRGVLENQGFALRAGQLLTANIVTVPTARSTVLAIPSAAVVFAQDGTFVFVRTTNGLEARPVDILASGGEHAFLNSGVDAGADVAVSGIATIKSIWLSGESGEE